MSSEDRRAREKMAVQERILNAARELFVKEGFEAVSLRKIAEAIDYTAPALYTHFKDKTELVKALCRQDFGALSGALVKAARMADPVQRIMRIGHGYIRFAVDNPHQYRFMMMTAHRADVEPDAEDIAEKDDPDRDGYAALRRAVADAIAQRLLRPEIKDAELGAQVLWAGVHGIASLQIAMGDEPWINWRSVERRARLMCESLLRGMLRDPARLEGGEQT